MPKLDIEMTNPGTVAWHIAFNEHNLKSNDELMTMAMQVPDWAVNSPDFYALVDILNQRKLIGHSDVIEHDFRNLGRRFSGTLRFDMDSDIINTSNKA